MFSFELAFTVMLLCCLELDQQAAGVLISEEKPKRIISRRGPTFVLFLFSDEII